MYEPNLDLSAITSRKPCFVIHGSHRSGFTPLPRSRPMNPCQAYLTCAAMAREKKTSRSGVGRSNHNKPGSIESRAGCEVTQSTDNTWLESSRGCGWYKTGA